MEKIGLFVSEKNSLRFLMEYTILQNIMEVFSDMRRRHNLYTAFFSELGEIFRGRRQEIESGLSSFGQISAEFRRRKRRFEGAVRSGFRFLGIQFKAAEITHRQLNKFLAAEFNVFDIIDPDENKISDIIAMLLSPDGEHGQGIEFLSSFLNILENKYMLNIPVGLGLDEVELIREYYLRGKRIDILIKFGEIFVIAIENKPWAEETERQLDDYAVNLMEKTHNNFLLIYLHGEGEKAKSISKRVKSRLEKEGKFAELPYNPFLIEWLVACRNKCESEKIRWFLKDFTEWIAVNFPKGGDNEV